MVRTWANGNSIIFLAGVLLSTCLGCAPHKPQRAPLLEPERLIEYLNPSPPFRLEVLMHAPGNFVFRVENLVSKFHLSRPPEISSATGRILRVRPVGEEGVEFQLILPGDAYVLSPDDVCIPWVLEEKGPAGFLRTEGKLLVDVAASQENAYYVKSVTYEPATDELLE